MFATNLSRSFLSTSQLSHYRELEFSTECSSGHLASPSFGCSSQYTSQIGRFDLTRGLVEGVQSTTVIIDQRYILLAGSRGSRLYALLTLAMASFEV